MSSQQLVYSCPCPFCYPDNEHETLISQIEELKIALEHAQMLRRRKIEYDLVAEKVNTLPSREELESYVFKHLALCAHAYTIYIFQDNICSGE